jgi:Pentapeptide repeats (8 copies)
LPVLQLVSAGAEHVEMLRRGPRCWNAWREQNPTTMPNLTGLRLSASERQMDLMNGGPINLASARMRSAYLRFATLSGASLAGANLAGADLTDARLDGANLVSADLSNAAGAHGSGRGQARPRKTGWRQSAGSQQSHASPARDAMGDAMTELPPHLTRPGFWLEDELDPALDVADGVEGPILPKGLSGSKNGTMSWLVGGAPVGSAKG